MTQSMLFAGGQIVQENEQTLLNADVLVEDGKIVAIEKQVRANPKTQTIDCKGKILLPGLFDMHVHLREPGREDKETIASGSAAAINGGITGVLAMPNTNPAIDNGGMVRFVQDRAREQGQIQVCVAGCISKNRAGENMAEIAEMHHNGVCMITDDGSPVANPYLLRRVLEYSRSFDILIGCHCEVAELSGDGAINEGRVSFHLGLPGIPACSEEICIARDLRLAQYTKGRIHIQHVSTAAGLEIIQRFKEMGVAVTCEVTPHHLLLSDEDITEYDTNMKMNPPLRTRKDTECLLEGLRSGVIDVIASDHAPHTEFEKNFNFAMAPFGITGLETALLALYTKLIKPEKLSWQQLVKAYSAEPRRILGLNSVALEVNNAAEFIVFDPEEQTTINSNFIRSRSANTPYLNKTLAGSVEMVILRDKVLLDRKGNYSDP